MGCGSDIQSHSAKGAMAIRIDGVQDFKIENVYIHNVVNWGELGTNICGEYESITFQTGVDNDKDIQYGYVGSKVHGILLDYASGDIKNVKIEHLKSYYGSTKAIAIYKGSVVNIDGNININQIIAGSKLTKPEASNLVLPNVTPFVCSIFIGPNSDSATRPDLTPIVQTTDNFAVLATDLSGYDYCTTNSRVGNMDTVYTPDQLFKTGTVINGDLVFSFSKNTMLFMASFGVIFVIIMLISLRSKIFNNGHDKQQDKLDKYKNSGTVYGSF